MAKIIKKTIAEKKTGITGKTSSNVTEIFSSSGGILNKKVLEAKDKSKVIIEESIEEAERIRVEARNLMAQVHTEMEKAKKTGYEKGREEALSSITEKAVALNHLRDKFYHNAEPDIIKLVIMIAEKVIGKMVRENESAIKSIVRQAVDSALGERITVKLNPDDYKIISSDQAEFKDMLDRTKRIVFKEDDSITKGGCVVETEVGTIDARLETQLKAIKKALEI